MPPASTLSQTTKPPSPAGVVLAGAMLAAVAMLLVPLPSGLLDLLWAVALAGSVVVLWVALGAQQRSKSALFPSLLVLTTVLRLALILATARSILLSADAGRVVSGLGGILVSGSYWAGAAMFVLLLVAQFVVVVRGSERIAEVRARFALDALPGAQLSIDADVRGGLIVAAEAQRQRSRLSSEAQFYGAMDGAMKFVRGEQIALLVILLFTSAAGAAVGMQQRGLTALDALRQYSVLAVGMGLLAEICAFSMSIAAAVLLTQTEQQDASLGEQLSRALWPSPRQMGAAAFVLLLLGLLPGVPLLPLAGIAAAMLAAAYWHSRRPDVTQGSIEQMWARGVQPWALDLSTDLAFLSKDGVGLFPAPSALSQAITQLRSQLHQDLGLAIPPCTIRINRALPARQCVLCVRDVPAMTLSLSSQLAEKDLLAPIAERASQVVRSHAAEFLGMTETQFLLDQLAQQEAAVTVKQTSNGPLSLAVLTDVLRRLVSEGVSIRDLKAILEALALAPAHEHDAANLVELIRPQLRRTLCHPLTHGANEVSVLLLDPTLEDLLRGAVTRSGNTSVLSLSAAAARDLTRATERALQQAQAAAPGSTPVVLTAPDVRRFLRSILEVDLPQLAVITPMELLPHLQVQPLATIHVRDL